MSLSVTSFLARKAMGGQILHQVLAQFRLIANPPEKGKGYR
jgi:hypothetical protein